MKYFKCILSIVLFFQVFLGFSQPLYFLCGPDEDGCPGDISQYCFCIPYGKHAGMPHCLNFKDLSCHPIYKEEDCVLGNVYPNKSQCLATIFQSTPIPGCKPVSVRQCIEGQSKFCDTSGRLNSCQ